MRFVVFFWRRPTLIFLRFPRNLLPRGPGEMGSAESPQCFPRIGEPEPSASQAKWSSIRSFRHGEWLGGMPENLHRRWTGASVPSHPPSPFYFSKRSPTPGSHPLSKKTRSVPILPSLLHIRSGRESGLKGLDDLVGVVNTTAPCSTADGLERCPEAGVVVQLGVGREARMW